MNVETVRSQLRTLKLHTAASELEEVLAENKKAVSLSWLSDLLEREVDARRERALMARIKRANFPEITTSRDLIGLLTRRSTRSRSVSWPH